MKIFSIFTKRDSKAQTSTVQASELARIQAQIFESALPPKRLEAYFSDATDEYADVITQEATLRQMRANSRKVYLNEGTSNHGAFISGIHATGGKGPSLRIISAKEKGRGGSDPTAPELSEEEREHIEWEWYYFSEAIDLTEHIRQAVEALQFDGELFFRMVYDPEIEDVQFNLEQIEAKRVRFPIEGETHPNIVGGILFKGLHPKSFFVIPKTLNPNFDWNWQAVQVPACDMIHFFIPRLPDQHRGMPWMQSVLNDIAETSIYEQYHLGAANAAARNSGGVVECPADAAVGQKIELQPTYTAPNPGEIKQLLPGLTYKQGSANWPTSNYGPYIESKREKHAAGMQLTKAMLTNNFEKHNYSSFRGEMIVYWEVVSFIRQRLEKMVLNRVFERFMECLAAVDDIAAEIVKKYQFRLSRIPRYWVWPPIPAYDMEAQVKALSTAMAAGFMSRKMCIEALGKDFEQVETDRKEDDFAQDSGSGGIQPDRQKV
ncbi:MAG: phage portal protein [Thermoguttaceae bacterium]|nr:phage portal protein [Thermoguttaceae bacterium]MBR0190435.1 phage portal protein [Thermoguttaceae bacterium]